MNFENFNKKLDELIVNSLNDNTTIEDMEKSLKLTLLTLSIMKR